MTLRSNPTMIIVDVDESWPQSTGKDATERPNLSISQS